MAWRAFYTASSFSYIFAGAYKLTCDVMIEVLILAVTFLWSVVWVTKKYLMHDAHSATVHFWERISLLFFVCLYMVVFDVGFYAEKEVVFCAALSGLCFTLLNALNFRLLRQIEVSSMSAVKALARLILGVIAGIVIFSEIPTGFHIAGTLIVVSGVLFITKISGSGTRVQIAHIGIATIIMVFFQGKMVFEKFALESMVPVQFVFYLMFSSLVYTTGYILVTGKGFRMGFSRKRVGVLVVSGFLLTLAYVILGVVVKDGSFILINIMLTSAVVFNFLSSQAARSFFGVDTETNSCRKIIALKFTASVVVMTGLIVALM